MPYSEPTLGCEKFWIGVYLHRADQEGQKWPHPFIPNLGNPNSTLERGAPNDRSAKSRTGHLVTFPRSMGPSSRSWGSSSARDHVLTPTSVRQRGAPGSRRPGFFTPSVPFLLGDSLDSAPQWVQGDLLPVNLRLGDAGTHRLPT